MLRKVIIVPGNGCTPVAQSNWYRWMKTALSARQDLFSEVVLVDMPDPYEAKESIWVPFILNELRADENTILIGHSSGAVAAMRLLENHRLHGCVLVSACHTDLGCESERVAGYYSRPWQWATIKTNADWIIQYHSDDDPFIPREEADHVASELRLEEGVEYHCLSRKSHYFDAKAARSVLEGLIAKVESLRT